jgi:phosphoadenosine phosphosulfate reductase
MAAPPSDHARLRALAARAGRDLEGASALDILRWADAEFGAGLCLTSSMSDGLLPHLASRVRPGIDVVFLDTGYHFAETIGTRDAVAQTYDVNVRTMLPLLSVGGQDAKYGPRLHDRDPDLCCAMRKVEPLERGLAPYSGWITGLRRSEAASRADTPVVDWDEDRSVVKVAPLAAWSADDVDAYLDEHGILVNPLAYDGYPSIGCGPCTKRVAPGDDPRSGRWSGLSKTECGLHV